MMILQSLKNLILHYQKISYLINKSENLKDVYRKQYIFSHFIFDDDTVDKVMNILYKTLNIGDEIVKDGNIIPQRIYMWYKNDNNEFKSLAFETFITI